MTKQINFEIPEPLARKVKANAAIEGVSMNDWGRIAFEQFLGKPAAARRVNLEGAKKKIVGRKIKP